MSLMSASKEKIFELDEYERIAAEKIIEQNKFSDKDIGDAPKKIRELLEFYQIRR